MGKGIFAGLEEMGLGNLKNADIYGEKEEKPVKEAVAPKKINEEDFLFDKTHECPVCNSSFRERTLRNGKARLLGTDMDLRARFEGIEPLKYDVVLCPRCGFTALNRYFVPMPGPQRKNILEKISANCKYKQEAKNVYTFEEAISRYKIALMNAVVKPGKDSEKAYICLRAGWLVRSYVESLEEENASADKIQEMKELEDEFLSNAYEGFANARQSEGYPMCGMDEPTVDYLLAALAIRCKQYPVASKIISSLLVSPSCGARMKDRVRDLKEELLKAMK